MRSFLRLALVYLLLTAPSSAVIAASTDLKDVPSGTYALDPDHASIVFRVSHFGYSYYTGRFDKFSATLEFDGKNPENSKLNVTIEPNSIDTNNAKLEEELKGDNYFNVIKYRRMNFVALNIKRTGSNTGKVEGNFTMLGVTQPITLNVTFNGWGEHFMKKVPVLGFSATGSLKRSAWGFMNLLPLVGDNVTFEIEAEFDKI
jgi:polyisoprenoid-binding protein YceI